MNSSWETVLLGDIAETRLGKTLPRGSGSDPDGYPYLRNANVQWGHVSVDDLNAMPFSEEERQALDLRRGDILICEGGEVGRLTVLEADMPGIGFQNAIHRVRTKPTALPKFVGLSLEHLVRTGGLDGIKSRLTIAHLNQSKLRNLPVALPQLQEQQRIVDLISSLDEALRRTETMCAAAWSAYQELLTAYMSAPTVRLPLSAALTRTALSEPVGDNQMYRIIGLERSGLGFIDRGQVLGSDISYSRLTPVSKDQLVYRKLTAWEGPISVADEESAGAWVSTEFPVFDVDESKLLPGLLRHVTRWPGFWKEMAAHLTGSVLRRKRLNPDQLLAITVPMPTEDIQARQLELLDDIWQTQLAGTESVSSLKALRSALLDALISGGHTIPESYDAWMSDRSI